MKKRFWAFALMVVMLISIFPVSVLAEENTAPGTRQRLTKESLEGGSYAVYHSMERIGDEDITLTLYCFNSDLEWPSTERYDPTLQEFYVPDPMLHLEEYEGLKDKIYRILYAGYPHNNIGLFSENKEEIKMDELREAALPPESLKKELTLSKYSWDELDFSLEKAIDENSKEYKAILEIYGKVFEKDNYKYLEAVLQKPNYISFLYAWALSPSTEARFLEAYRFVKPVSTVPSFHDATQIAIWRILYESQVPCNSKDMVLEMSRNPIAKQLVDFANGVGEYADIKIPPRDNTFEKMEEYKVKFETGSKILREDGTSVGANGTIVFTKKDGKYISEPLHFADDAYELPYIFDLIDGTGPDKSITNYGAGKFRLVSETKPSSGVVTVKADDKLPSDVYQYVNENYADKKIEERPIQDMAGVYYQSVPMSLRFNAEFREEQESGNLKVTKTVNGYPAEASSKEFKFKVELSENTINGLYGSMNFENGVATFTLQGGHFREADNLPVNITYTVTEEDYSGDGFVTTFTGNTGEIQKNKTVEAVFVNTYNRAVVSFKGNKTLNGRKLSEGEFSFTITDYRDNTTETVKNAADGTIDFGVYEFADEGEFKFTVKEVNGSKKGVTYDNKEYNITVTVTKDGTGKLTATITGIPSADDINFTNSYKEDDKPDDDHHDDGGGGSGETSITRNGSLTISKNVTGDLGDKNKLFTFHVAFNTDNYYAYTGSKTGVIKNGGTLQLKDGESITINGIPSGVAYAIVESDNAGYRVYKTGDAGIIVADQTLKASFTNTKSSVPQTGDNRHLFIWMGIMAISFIGCIISLVFTIRKRESHE